MNSHVIVGMALFILGTLLGTALERHSSNQETYQMRQAFVEALNTNENLRFLFEEDECSGWFKDENGIQLKWTNGQWKETDCPTSGDSSTDNNPEHEAHQPKKP